jgi:hypothetical protein
MKVKSEVKGQEIQKTSSLQHYIMLLLKDPLDSEKSKSRRK